MITKTQAPYVSTSVDFKKTQLQITRLLEKYGCEAVQWTTIFKTPQIELRFVLETEIEGARKKLSIEIKPPIFAKRDRSGKYVANLNQSLRLLFWYLKTKLEAISFGLVTIENEFLYNIVFQLPDGTRGTVGNAIIGQLNTEKVPKLTGRA